MTIIEANRNHLYSKVAILIVLFGLIALFTTIAIHPGGNDLRIGNNQWLMPLIMDIFLLLMAFIIAIQLFYLPIGVDILDSSGELGIKYLLQKPIYYRLSDVDFYCTTKVYTRFDQYEGIVLHLISGKRIILSDFNLQDYSPIKRCFDETQIKNNGAEKFGMIAYYSQAFKST